ncbi:hypothetical protein BT96DRAFT_951066 [Gymnopus androsaceus JB14]|uniref:Uncharacterized protein n=1 Tax=Gymnopus androsaceus JB14 TaxID=1447944 RepID=A0A6A4GE91_9AGAR|nr:hypothetical protein BT96DRAFT_951066 [Gymnopus androsaceus JB14]
MNSSQVANPLGSESLMRGEGTGRSRQRPGSGHASQPVNTWSKRTSSTQHTSATSSSSDETYILNRTLTRQEAMSIVQKYHYMFKANGVTLSRLQSTKATDDISTPVKSIIGSALLQYKSLDEAERDLERRYKEAAILGGPATSTARTYRVPLHDHTWVVNFWQEAWQVPIGTIYMEIYDPCTNAAVAMSPQDFVFSEVSGICPSLQANEEFRAGVRNHKTGKLCGGRVSRSVDKDTWVVLGRKRYYLVLPENDQRFIIDTPDIPSALDYVFSHETETQEKCTLVNYVRR